MMICCFFFQAEDGIRVGHVTGVQTCALPISPSAIQASPPQPKITAAQAMKCPVKLTYWSLAPAPRAPFWPHSWPNFLIFRWRSEERRVGKECRAGSWEKAYEKEKWQRGEAG